MKYTLCVPHLYVKWFKKRKTEKSIGDDLSFRMGELKGEGRGHFQ